MLTIKKIIVTKNKAEVAKKFQQQIDNKEAVKNHVRSGLPLKTFKPLNA